MLPPSVTTLGWGDRMKSSYSGALGNCVDAVIENGEVVVRDSKRKTGDAALIFTQEEWHAFLLGVKDHEFDYEKLPVPATGEAPAES